jgi:RNA recognition motif-containing protein
LLQRNMPRGGCREADNKFRGNVFVSNLPPSFMEAQLDETFDRFGIVIDVLLARDPETGESRRCALLNLAPQRAAEEAVNALDGAHIGGSEDTGQPCRS